MGSKIKKGVKKKVVRKPSKKKVTKKSTKKPSEPAIKKPVISKRLSTISKRSNQERPPGISALLHYTVILAMLSIIAIFTSPRTLFFGFDIGGLYAAAFSFFFFALNVAIIYGIAYKERWTYWVAATSYLLSILNSILAIVPFGNLSPVMESMMGFILPASFISIFMNLVTLWFIYEKREYFRTWEAEDDLVDHVFRLIVYVFLVILVLMVLVLFGGVVFFIQTGSSKMMTTISGMSFTESQAYCDSRVDDARDRCYVLMTSIHSEEDGVHKICNGVERPFYQYLCRRMVE